MKASQLRELTADELSEKYRGFKDELFNLRFQLATGQLEKFDRIRAVRRDLARVLTIMHQKQQSEPESSAVAGGKR